jgi:hypothetical protein
MAPCFEGDVQLRKQALVGFLLMPHLVTNNHVWAPQGRIQYQRRPQTGGRSIGVAYHADMYAGDVAASTCTIAGRRRDPDALQLREHPEGFDDANDASLCLRRTRTG